MSMWCQYWLIISIKTKCLILTCPPCIFKGINKPSHWTIEEINDFRNQFKNGTLTGLYERENVEDITL